MITKILNTIQSVWTHPANQGQRVQAVFRATRYQLRARIFNERTQARLGEKSLIWVDPHRSGAVRVVYANPPDYPEMLIWRDNLHPGDLFVDVGANIGGYSIWAAELGADVIALEPAEDTFQCLRDNITLNNYAIVAIQAAAGPTCGDRRFSYGKDTLNRFDPEGSVKTKVLTIDSIIKDRVVAGMKVDVEGFELDVLRGCQHALSERRIRLIQLEWNHASLSAFGTDRRPVADFLAEYGYSLHRPVRNGNFLPLKKLEFGPDVFAQPPH